MKCQTNLLLLFFALFTCTLSFANQTIESEGQMIELSEATICSGSSVTMEIPQDAIPEDYVWLKDDVAIGIGASFTIENFTATDAGEYRLVQTFFDGTFDETIFNLHFLNLGEDIITCGTQTIDFNVADGPQYTWSNGSTANSFSVTFTESGSISVSAITEFGCIAEDDLSVDVSTFNYELSVNPIDGNCCQSTLELNITASENAFPILIYADFNGQQTMLGQFNGSGQESFVKDMGVYSNVHAFTDSGCIWAMDDFTIENQGPFFGGPHMRSNYIQKGIQEATICEGGSVILFVPEFGTEDEYIWMKGEEFLGFGFSLEVQNFDQGKAGIYTSVQNIPGGGEVETVFKLNFLNLGETINSCGSYDYEITLPHGPSYTWSDGTLGKTFSQEITETTTISVSAVNEFDCVSTSEKTITIEDYSMTTILDPLTVCAGGPIVLNAPLGFASYYWSTGETTPEIAIAPTYGENISVEAYDENGCPELFYFIFDFLPQIDLAVVQGETSSDCQMADMQFVINNPTEAYLPVDILAYVDGQQILVTSLSDFDQTVQLEAGEYKYVKALAQSGCSLSLGSFTVEPDTTPELIEMDPLSVCTQSDLVLTAPDGYDTYEWNNGDKGMELYTQAMPGESYQVLVTKEGECPKLFNYNLDLVTFSAALAPTGASENCVEGDVQISISTTDEMVYPVDIYAHKNDEQILLTSMTQADAIIYLAEGEYRYVKAIGQSGCSMSLGSFEVEIDRTPELIEMEPISVCTQSDLVLTAPEGFDSYEWNNGETGNEIITQAMPGDVYQVLALKEGTCPKLFNYNLDLVTFYAAVAATGSSQSCGFGDVQFNITASNDMVFPVDIYAHKDGEQFLLTTMEQADETISLEVGEYRYTKAIGQSGCVQSLPSFTVENDTKLQFGYEINTEASTCEYAVLDFHVNSTNQNDFPVEVYAEMDGQEYLIAMLFSEFQQVILDDGTYVNVYGVTNSGCTNTIPDFVVSDFSSDAGISVKNPTNPCSEGKITITTDESNEEAFPMRLTAFFEPINDWIEIGIVTKQNQTFPAQVGAYFDVELKNQFDCIVSFAQFEIQPHENPCSEGEAKPSGSIEDFVFFDKNENGIYDEGDYGVVDVRVNAVNIDGDVVKSTMSQPDGRFLIDEIPVGDYYLHFDLPGQLGFTTPNVGDDDTMDSDVDHSNGPATTPYLDISNRSGGSGFTAGVGAFVLPVSWATINAQNHGDFNKVEWSTASEDDLDYFVIERRLGTSNNFEAIEKVSSLGSVYQGARYAYEDNDFGSAELAYYRIQSVDFDGSLSYSKTVVVSMERRSVSAEMSVFPNPTSDFVNLKITGTSEDTQLITNIFNEVGERVLTQENNVDFSTPLQIDLGNLTTGTYVVQTIIDGQRFSKKIVVIK